MIKVDCFTLGELAANCYFIRDEENGVSAVIDPGDYSASLNRAIDSFGAEKLKYILLTHGHFDHISGTAALRVRYPHAKIVIGSPDRNYPTNERLNLCYHFGDKVDPFRCDIFVDDGDELPFGENKITVMLTPGHTSGSVCYRTGDLLFTGDTLMTGTTGRTDFPTGSYEEMISSIERLAAIPENLTVYCGHGESTTLDRERAYNYFMRKS